MTQIAGQRMTATVALVKSVGWWMELTWSWLPYAWLSAAAAALTPVLAKVGLEL